MSSAKTLTELLETYLLFRDVKPGTEKFYRQIVKTYSSWAGCDVPLDRFDGRGISRFLADKQHVGRSPSYLKSLRNGLVALLRHHRGDAPIERVRGVKIPDLDPEAWTPEQVEQLVAACECLPEDERWFFETFIPAAYYTGLDGCDLLRMERRHILEGGVIPFHRSKTGKPVVVGLPQDLLARIDRRAPEDGPIWRWTKSREWLRRQFQKLVKKAGLRGTIKKLRKTSGTGVDLLQPGHGHEHLGNTRQIFEKHYRARALFPLKPWMPKKIKLPR